MDSQAALGNSIIKLYLNVNEPPGQDKIHMCMGPYLSKLILLINGIMEGGALFLMAERSCIKYLIVLVHTFIVGALELYYDRVDLCGCMEHGRRRVPSDWSPVYTNIYI